MADLLKLPSRRNNGAVILEGEVKHPVPEGFTHVLAHPPPPSQHPPQPRDRWRVAAVELLLHNFAMGKKNKLRGFKGCGTSGGSRRGDGIRGRVVFPKPRRRRGAQQGVGAAASLVPHRFCWELAPGTV